MTGPTEKLKPCPFCGSSGIHLRQHPTAQMSWVSCVGCGLEAPSETGVTDDDAVTYWNTRALTAALAVEAGTVGVKPLEWKEGDGITCDVLYHTAETPFGLTYWQIECQWGVQGGYVEAYGDEETDEAAKAAAQADYEARIRSALTTSPASSGVEGEAVAEIVDMPDGTGRKPVWFNSMPPSGTRLYAAPAPQTEGK